MRHTAARDICPSLSDSSPFFKASTMSIGSSSSNPIMNPNKAVLSLDKGLRINDVCHVTCQFTETLLSSTSQLHISYNFLLLLEYLPPPSAY